MGVSYYVETDVLMLKLLLVPLYVRSLPSTAGFTERFNICGAYLTIVWSFPKSLTGFNGAAQSDILIGHRLIKLRMARSPSRER